MSTVSAAKRFVAAAIFLGLAVFGARANASGVVLITPLGGEPFYQDAPPWVNVNNACQWYFQTNELTIEILDGTHVNCTVEYSEWERNELTIEILD